MNPTLEIFSQGEEIVTGQVVDTNAAWLSQQAVDMGFTVTRHTAVGDKLKDLADVLLDISMRADCCLCTGGLGPTSDDLTTEAVATAFAVPLVFDEVAYTQIAQFFRNRNRDMPECNRKQAMLPQGSIRLDNHTGTAPGFALKHGRCWFAFVPGVPSEMRQMFLDHVQPLLTNRFSLRPDQLITIKTIGIGESDLQERINTIGIPSQVRLGFRAELGEVQVKLLFPGNYPDAEREVLTNRIATTIGDAVYAIEDPRHQSSDLVSVVDQLMTTGGHNLAILETISHGLLAAKLVGTTWLLSALFEQSIENLTHRLQVDYHPEDLLATAKTIAIALQKNSGADMALIQLASSGGIDDSNQKKGTTIINLLGVNNKFTHTVRTLAGDIKRKQQQSALLSLDLLRRQLQTNPISLE